jgi:hypothetical protein
MAMSRELAGDPERAAALDRAFHDIEERWRSEDRKSLVYAQEALLIVARKRRSD